MITHLSVSPFPEGGGGSRAGSGDRFFASSPFHRALVVPVVRTAGVPWVFFAWGGDEEDRSHDAELGRLADRVTVGTIGLEQVHLTGGLHLLLLLHVRACVRACVCVRVCVCVQGHLALMLVSVTNLSGRTLGPNNAEPEPGKMAKQHIVHAGTLFA